MRQQLDYYNQYELWGNDAEFYQVQMKIALLDVLPQDVSTILDVGCGDGYITNDIPDKYDVVGLDISQEALKHVTKKSQLGSISDIPFENNSFDLIMTNDVLEHLPDEVYKKALNELFRVASKYVIVTVPYAEQLDRMNVVCRKCDTKYHISHHIRSISENDFLKYDFDEWEIKEFCYSGDITKPLSECSSSLAEEFEVYKEYPHSVCPSCGYDEIKKNENNHIKRVLKNSSFIQSFKDVDNCINHNNRSELIVVFSKKNLKYQRELTHIPAQLDSFYKVDFSNLLQKVEDFTEGFFWSRYKLDENKIICQLPVVAQKGDIIKLLFKEKIDYQVSIVLENDLLGYSVFLQNADTDDAKKLNFSILEDIDSSFYGLNMTILANIDDIKSVDYLPASKSINADFVNIKQGLNIFRKKNNSIFYSNIYFSNIEGRFPYPKFLQNNIKETKNECEKSFIVNSLELFAIKNGLLKSKLSELLNQKEEIRVQLELTNNQLKEQISQKNVLVFSHMYPNDIQKNLGCFVEEQVMALKMEYKTDIKVVSGQPFWIETKNPKKIYHSLKNYIRTTKEINWKKINDIDVLYVPYIVGNPLFRFSLHSLLYAFGIFLVRKKIFIDYKVNLIHAHTSYLDGTAANFLSKIYKIKYVITEHTGPFSYLTKNKIVKFFTNLSIKNATYVFPVSHALKEDMIAKLSLKDDSKFVVLGNGFDEKIFYPTNKNTLHSPIKILSIIHLDDNKNPFLLLKAFKNIIDKEISATLTIVGNGTLKEPIIKWLFDNSLNDKVKLIDSLERKDIADVINNECDIFVHPSKSETFGVVVLEALACGKVVVCTKCGGPEDFIEDMKNGYLCKNNNITDLEKLINLAIKSFDKLSTDNIASSVSEYRYSNMSKVLLKLYSDVHN